jgi:hypothetical protein
VTGNNPHVAIQSLVNRLWNRLDRRDYEAVVQCFLPEGRWFRGQWCEGREAIMASLMQRPDNLVVRHLITNLELEEQQGDYHIFLFATAIARYVTAEERPPYALERISLLAEMTGKVRFVEGLPFIQELRARSIFRDASLN